LAAVNILAFTVLLAMRHPEYEKLSSRDESLRRSGMLDISTADPIYMAGRPFYSSAHVANVPLVEDLYLLSTFQQCSQRLSSSPGLMMPYGG
jgi:hypothetical protein